MMWKQLPLALFVWAATAAPVVLAAELKLLPADVVLTGPHARHQLLAVQGANGKVVVDQTNHATYKSSNDKIAAVDTSGNVRAVSDGEATITATQNGQAASVVVKVKNTKDDFRWSFRNHI